MVIEVSQVEAFGSYLKGQLGSLREVLKAMDTTSTGTVSCIEFIDYCCHELHYFASRAEASAMFLTLRTIADDLVAGLSRVDANYSDVDALFGVAIGAAGPPGSSAVMEGSGESLEARDGRGSRGRRLSYGREDSEGNEGTCRDDEHGEHAGDELGLSTAAQADRDGGPCSHNADKGSSPSPASGQLLPIPPRVTASISFSSARLQQRVIRAHSDKRLSQGGLERGQGSSMNPTAVVHTSRQSLAATDSPRVHGGSAALGSGTEGPPSRTPLDDASLTRCLGSASGERRWEDIQDAILRDFLKYPLSKPLY
ncbi:hypothetical protein FOZ63_027741 [Perkinsus olseni]|uniref:EF-hand domain-containing protein n=1 Tax=Perkinsus olseni TaxID=32597 RepID=A0A7J6T378_PEROL|nr:hypothetical protein FOZ62_000853 [Perkinsus olseni]KAF4739461.1 hypothetical protein FOZ63_027741 [Perkinsus olseni]